MKSLQAFFTAGVCSVMILFTSTMAINHTPSINKIKTKIYPICRQCMVNYNSSKLLKDGCSQLDASDMITLYYDDIDLDTVSMINDITNISLGKVCRDLKFNPSKKINMAVLAGQSNISTLIGDYDFTSCMGAYYHGFILILQPSNRESCTSHFKEEFSRDGPIVHELAHYVVDHKTNGNKPVWFTEGIALLEEWRINNTLGRYGQECEEYYSVCELQDNFHELEPVKAYTQSFKIINYIVENYGMESLCHIMDDLAVGHSIEYAVKNIFNINLDELFHMSLMSKEKSR